jgi:hypothetical protein
MAAWGKCFDPTGARHGIPTYPWRCAPDGLATRRQLRARGLRPGGQPVAAQVLRPRYRRGPLVAYLYRLDKALIPATLGVCVPCAYPDDQKAA